MSRLPVGSSHRLRTHGGQDIVSGRQTDEQGEWDEPDAQAEVRGNHREARHVGGVVVGGALVRSCLGTREVPEPDVVVDQDED